jgi:secretory phospholipase A2
MLQFFRLLLLVPAICCGMQALVAGAFLDGATCDMSNMCPHGSQMVPNPSHLPSSNGCGTMGVRVSTGAFDFEPCCETHDLCYDRCGSSRQECDEEFAHCLQEYCAECDGGQQCSSSARLFHLGSSTFGCAAFQDAQRQACMCVDANGEQVRAVESPSPRRRQRSHDRVGKYKKTERRSRERLHRRKREL